MAQPLVTSSPVVLPAIDTADPATMLLLPAWLTSQVGAVSDLGAGRTVVDPKTGAIIARIPTIPTSKMPSGPQRKAIERRITELRAAGRPGPAEHIIEILGELIQEYAPSRLDPKTVRVKAEAYMDAVEDLPAWTIREAIRRWHRGEVSADEHALDFMPKPPRLRRIAEGIARVAQGQAIRLQRILDAEPEDELSEAQRGEMQARIAAEVRPQVVEAPNPPSQHRREIADHLADLAARKAKREADEQSSLSEQLKAGREPFVASERKGEAA